MIGIIFAPFAFLASLVLVVFGFIWSIITIIWPVIVISVVVGFIVWLVRKLTD